jgi:hypothetical protein
MLLHKNWLTQSPQHAIKLSREILRPPRFAFPNHYNAPAEVSELSQDALITRLVPIKLGGPELAIRFGSVSEPASGMPMPETAVNEDSGAVPRKHNVRFARQVAAMQAKSIAESMQHRSDDAFRRRVSTCNSRHVPASALLGNIVHFLGILQPLKMFATMLAISRAIKGGTAFPT